MPTEVKLERTGGGFTIHRCEDGLEVGRIDASGYDAIHYLEVYEPYRGNGICRSAVEVYCDEAQQAGSQTIRTTEVEHPAMRHVLEKLEFEKTENLDDRFFWRYEDAMTDTGYIKHL